MPITSVETFLSDYLTDKRKTEMENRTCSEYRSFSFAVADYNAGKSSTRSASFASPTMITYNDSRQPATPQPSQFSAAACIEDYFVRSMRLSIYLNILPQLINAKKSDPTIYQQSTQIIADLAYLPEALEKECKKMLSQAQTPEDLVKTVEEIKKLFSKSPIEENYFCNINYQVRDFVILNLQDETLALQDLEQLEHYCTHGNLPTNAVLSQFMRDFYQAVIGCTIQTEYNPQFILNKRNFIGYIKSRDSSILQELPTMYANIEKQLFKQHQDQKQHANQQYQVVLRKATEAINDVLKKHAKPQRLPLDASMGNASWQCDKKGKLGFETKLSLKLPKKIEKETPFTLNLVVDASLSMNSTSKRNQQANDESPATCWQLTLNAVEQTLRHAFKQEIYHQCLQLNLIIFGELALTVYNHEPVTEDLINNIIQKLNKERDNDDDIGFGTYYLEAIEEIKNNNWIGPVLWMSDGEATDHKEISNNDFTQSCHTQILPVYFKTDQHLNLNENSTLAKISSPGFPIITVENNPHSFEAFFTAIQSIDIIKQPYPQLTYTIEGTDVITNQRQQLDSNSLFFNGEESTITVPLLKGRFFKQYHLQIQGQQPLDFGVDATDLYAMHQVFLQLKERIKQSPEPLKLFIGSNEPEPVYRSRRCSSAMRSDITPIHTSSGSRNAEIFFNRTLSMGKKSSSTSSTGDSLFSIGDISHHSTSTDQVKKDDWESVSNHF